MSSNRSTPSHRHDERSIAEQAADWVVELADGGPQERAALANWLRESPRHVEEYLIATMLYSKLDNVDAGKQISLDEALAEASFNVLPLKTSAVDVQRVDQNLSLRRGLRWAPVAALAACCLLGVWWFFLRSQVDYSTGIGELRSVELSDGSVVDLNTQSRIEVQYTADARTIQLLAGEALFKVERDTLRPFTVEVGHTKVRALGTKFNIYRRPSETSVSVIEGAVQVSEGAATAPGAAQETVASPHRGKHEADSLIAKLNAGEGARISANGAVERVAAVDAVKVMAWRERRLVFVDDVLADIAAEFNRYNESPRLRVEGKYASTRELTGVFDAGDPQSLVQFLENLGEFSVNKAGGEIVIRQR